MTMYRPIAHSLFRAYDVRGVYGQNLTEHSAYLIGQAVGSELRDQGVQAVLLGRDGRLSSPSLAQAACEGLRQAGCHVIDLGMVPTPALYFAIQSGLAPNGLMVTGSHNPPDQNGLKIVIKGQCQYQGQIQRLYQRIVCNDLWEQPQQSRLVYANILPDYQRALSHGVHLQRPLRISVDCGNGVTALLAADLFRQLGCEVHPLFCEVDGRFPHHSPDPTAPANLHALQELVQARQLDLGIAFDGDGDRMIAVDGTGHILWPDRILMYLAQTVLPAHPGRMVVYDVKCTHRLHQAIHHAGGEPLMCASGHSLLKQTIRTHNAILGGEFSGHIVLRDRGMEYDDGMYIAARLLEALSHEADTPRAVFQRIPEDCSTPELKVCYPNYEAAQAALQRWQAGQCLHAERLVTLDGIRAEYADGWGLVRASNTSPCLTLRFEAASPERLAAIQDLFRADMQRLQLTTDTLPF